MKRARVWACGQCEKTGLVVKKVDSGSETNRAMLFLIKARGEHFEISPSCKGEITLVERWLVREILNDNTLRAIQSTSPHIISI